MATSYLDEEGLRLLVQKIQAMPDGTTLEYTGGELKLKDNALESIGVNDSVIAEGTSGNWHYIKWKSGFAEIKGKILLKGWSFTNKNMFGSLNLGGPSGKYAQVPEEPLPFTLSEVHDINASTWIDNSKAGQATSGMAFLDQSANFDAKKEVNAFPKITLARPGAIENVDVFVSRSITGRWK